MGMYVSWGVVWCCVWLLGGLHASVCGVCAPPQNQPKSNKQVAGLAGKERLKRFLEDAAFLGSIRCVVRVWLVGWLVGVWAYVWVLGVRGL